MFLSRFSAVSGARNADLALFGWRFSLAFSGGVFRSSPVQLCCFCFTRPLSLCVAPSLSHRLSHQKVVWLRGDVYWIGLDGSRLAGQGTETKQASSVC